MKTKLILYIAMSLDGYIAGPNDSLDFLSRVEQPGEDYGYTAFTDTIDTVIMGRRTYDKVLAMGYSYPHAHKESYIITRSTHPSIGNINFYNGNLNQLIAELKARNTGKHIYCDGGAEIVHLLLAGSHIDEFIISIIPVLLGGGVSLFRDGRQSAGLELLASRTYESGLVQLHYKQAN